MWVQGIDERRLVGERQGANFVAFVFDGDDDPGTSWAVDSWLFTDAELANVLLWLQEKLPRGRCWSLGLVRDPARPTTTSELQVDWIVGGDVLNVAPRDRSPEETRLARAMIARSHRVDLP